MIRTYKSDNRYKLVDYTDILLGISVASKLHNNEFVNFLSNIFSDMQEENVTIDKKNYVKIKSDSKVIPFLLEKAHIIDYDKYIDHDVLKDAFMRAYFEFNHEMKNKLSLYFRKYVENEIEGIDNTIIKEEIINDKELIKYIKKYDNFTMYLEDKVNINIQIKDKLNVKKI